MKRFLALKHWQLFVLLIGIPMILQIVFVAWAFSGDDPARIISQVTLFFPIIMALCLGIFFGWFYSLGVNLFKKLPASATMSLTRFKLFLIIPVIYILYLAVFMFGISPRALPNGPDPRLFLLIIPVHIFCMFCIFYCLYFNAKALKSVELQRPVTFSDYAGEFLLLWFFPIGVWIIQPRINRLFVSSPE